MIDPSKVLSGIPSALREPLLASYREIAAYYIEGKWGPSELLITPTRPLGAANP